MRCSFSILTCATVCALWSDATAQETTQEKGDRNLERAGPSAVHPDLVWALDELSSVQHRLFLAHVAFESGEREDLEVWIAEAIDALPSEGREALDGGGLSIDDVVEIGLSARAGALFETAFERSVAADDPVQPAHVLALFSPAFLRSSVDHETWPATAELQGVMQELAGVSSATHPQTRLEIGPRNAGRLAFACLHERSFWSTWKTETTDGTQQNPGPKPESGSEQDIGPREDLIHFLIRCVEEAEEPDLVAPLVLSALRFPLRWTANVAGPRAVITPDPCEEGRAKVGFRRRDLTYLRELITGIEEQRLQWGEDAPIASDGPLVDFATSMRRRIEWELLPDTREGGSFRMFRGSLRQQKSDWRWYLENFGVFAFWEQARGEIHAMLRGEATHPLDGDLQALEQTIAVLEREDPAREDLERTLARLRKRRVADQDDLTAHLLQLLAQAGPPDVVWEELDVMDREIEQVRGTSQLVVTMAWLTAVQENPEFAGQRLQAHFRERDPEPLTRDALEAALYQANHAPSAGSRELIFDAGIRGTPMERQAAMRHSSSLSPDEARTLFETAVDDLARALDRQEGGSMSVEARQTRWYLLSAAGALLLRRAAKGEWTGFEHSLRQVFERDGVQLWQGVEGLDSGRVPWPRELVNLLPDPLYRELTDSGSIPPALQALRGRPDG